MLKTFVKHDRKWMKTDLQLFTREGLASGWENLLRDGEYVDEDSDENSKKGGAPVGVATDPALEGDEDKSGNNGGGEDTEKKGSKKSSGFMPMLEQWTWGEEPELEQLQEALTTIVTEQQLLANSSALSTPSLTRLKQRLLLMERYFIAMENRGLSGDNEESIQQLNAEQLTHKRKSSVQPLLSSLKSSPTVTMPASNATDGLAKVGTRTALSFAFAFLKRAWRSGEDCDLCTEVLQQTLDVLQELPIPSLFDGHDMSNVWLEVIDRCMEFLKSVCQSFNKDKMEIPLEDRQKALLLLLELSLQRGCLQHIIDSILLLLQLADEGSRSNELLKAEPRACVGTEVCYPLVPFLRRMESIAKTNIGMERTAKHGSAPKANPSRAFLDHVSLPNDEKAKLELRQVAALALAHLDLVADPYLQLEEQPNGVKVDIQPSAIMHWGSRTNLANSPEPTPPSSSQGLLDLETKMVCSSAKQRIIMTTIGTVYSVVVATDGTVSNERVQFPTQDPIIQLSHSTVGKHCLALSKSGEVFSWGEGGEIIFGHGESGYHSKPTRVSGLSDRKIVQVSAGSVHSAAVTEEGELYTWGRGTYGRLGHGNTDDCSTPKVIESLAGVHIVHVQCGSEDAHTLALDDTGRVWSWGDGEYGKLGRGGADSCKVPKVITDWGTEGTVEIVNIFSGNQVSMALSKDGKLYSWGFGELFQLGHGDEEHVRTPKLITALEDHVINDVSIGAQHCLALTIEGKVFGWGKNTSGEVDGSDDIVNEPILIEAVSGRDTVGVSCGAYESFVIMGHSPKQLSFHLPFILDVCENTFVKLDKLLRIVCEGLDDSRSSTHPSINQEQECMAVATLKLLKLQLFVASSTGAAPEDIGLAPGSPLLHSLKDFIVTLAGGSGVYCAVQRAAQSVLRSGWNMLLYTVSERASALSELLPSGEGILQRDPLPEGQQFMIQLLVSSLMADRGLEKALTSAIAHETSSDVDPVLELSLSHDQSVPLLHLVQQLIGNSTSMHLTYFKQLLLSDDPKKTDTLDDGHHQFNFDSSSMKLLQLFQRQLLSTVYCQSKKDKGNTGATQSAISVLVKYIAMVQEHVNQVLPLAIRVAGQGAKFYEQVLRVLNSGVCGCLLPEIAVGLILLQLHSPALMCDCDCVPLLRGIVCLLDRLNRIASCADSCEEDDMLWPGVKRAKGCNEGAIVITREEMEIHNQKAEGGAWTIMHGKVYNLDALSKQASFEADVLTKYAGKDCFEVFEKQGQSQKATELAKAFYIGEFCEDVPSDLPPNECSVLLDTERSLALLQGLRACFMVKSLPVLPEEEASRPWLSMEIFSSGLESQAFNDSEICYDKKYETVSESTKSYRRLSVDENRSFIFGLVHPEVHNSKASVFMSLVYSYCKQNHMTLPLVEQNSDHPVERFARLFIACLLKLHDLVHLALSLVEQETSLSKEPESSVQFPPALADICKLVFDAKMSLVKARQESSCSYDEICGPAIDRCLFLIENIRSAVADVMGVLRKHQILSMYPRWKGVAKKAMAWIHSGEREGDDNVGHSSREEAESVKVNVYDRQASKELMTMMQSHKDSSWDTVTLELASSRKFKWLRERVGGSSHHTMLLNQIKNFVLTDDVDVKLLTTTLQRQSVRARQRLAGAKALMDILSQHDLLPSVRYSTLCGWQGLVVTQPTAIRCHNYSDNIEYVTPSVLAEVDMEFQRISQWSLDHLRDTSIELEKNYNQFMQTKPPGLDSATATTVQSLYTVGCFTASRFLVSLINMVTCENQAVDLSHLINNGLLGITQTILKLSGVTEMEQVVEEEETKLMDPALSLTEEDVGQFVPVGPASGPDVVPRLLQGVRVVKGPDWKWGDQNGPIPGEGTVISEVGSDGWVRVRWDTGSVNSYRMGKEDKFDLRLAPSELAPKTKPEEVKEEMKDVQIMDALCRDPNFNDLPTSFLYRATIHLLRSLMVGLGVHSTSLHPRTSNSAATLLLHIMQCSTTTHSDGDEFLMKNISLQLSCWATPGFMRGFVSNNSVGSAFCSDKWMKLVMKLLENSLQTTGPKQSWALNSEQQVLFLRFLRAVLPSWEAGSSTTIQEDMVESLFKLLGEMMIFCNSPFGYSHKKKRRNKVHTSLLASQSSTIAEEIVVLIRRLHPLPSWNKLINKFIGMNLQSVPILVMNSDRYGDDITKEEQLKEDVATYATALAVLTVIGGLDDRPRIGGLVQHDELGSGTITKIPNRNRAVVLFHGRNAKLCPLTSLKTLPIQPFRVDQLPMSDTVMGIWSSLVRLAGSGEGVIPAVFGTLAQSHVLSGPPAKTAKRNSSCEEIDMAILRQQQIRLGLLKAARTIFSQQENLQQIMSHPGHHDDDSQYSLFQQLLSAATRPSPIKAMFGRDELEAAAISVCQFLAAEVYKPEGVDVPKEKGATRKKSVAHPVKKPPISKPVPELPPPAPIVTQLMEMGFQRRIIEYAIEVIGVSADAERLVAWLIDHPNIQVPDIPKVTSDEPQDTPTPKPSSQEEMMYVTSSDDEEEEEEGEEDLELEQVDPADIQAAASLNLIPSTLFKTRDQFSLVEEYSRYVKDNVCVGMSVLCCENCEDVRKGDTGKVTKIDHDDVHHLNIQVLWTRKSGAYWVRYSAIEITGVADSPMETGFKPGDRVRVKKSVKSPKYKWGCVTHGSVGVVRSVNRNGLDVCVDFPEQSKWTGLIAEMEFVPGMHPRHRCEGCGVKPIEGPRFHCQVCADFDFCQDCFIRGQAHNHVFERVDDQGYPAVYVGSPRSCRLALRKKKKKMMGGSVVNEWDQIVRHISVSSNENQASRLMDGSDKTYWQSSGAQGKHWIRLEIQPKILIEQLSMEVSPLDASYMPSSVIVYAGQTVGGLKEVKQCNVPSTAKEFPLITGLTEYYAIIEISIKACKSGGIDTKVHGISIIGRVDMTEEEVAANFSFLTVDEIMEDSGQMKPHRKKHDFLDGQISKVFVWGLNDCHQLGGGLAESKVKAPLESRALAKLHPMQFVGGSRTLYLVTHDGKVFACGESSSGRLGVGRHIIANSPCQLSSLSTYVVRKVATHSGGRHVLALTADGKVFSWGDGEYGQLGHGSTESYDRPKMIDSFQGKHIKDIACGSSHSAAITSNGELYTWGQGDSGRLGHGDTANQTRPKQVRALEKIRVQFVACSSRDAHTLAAGENNSLWGWGDNSFGKLGVAQDKEMCDVPVKIMTFSSGIVQLECGMQFSAVLTKDGKVFTWGKGDYYRLGHGTTDAVTTPTAISELEDVCVIQVAVGALHTLALSNTGEVYSWGDNEYGQLGTGGNTIKKPQLVASLKDYKISKIACGSSHSIAYSQGTPTTASEFSAVSFATPQDPLGATMLSAKLQEDSKEGTDVKRPSLTRIIVSMNSNSKCQEALGHVLTALQIAYARETIVNALSGVVFASVNDREAHSGNTAAIEITGGVPLASPSCDDKQDSDGEGDPMSLVSELEEFTHLLTVEDARVIVDLLKLAVAGRVGENGKETLSIVLNAMGKASPEVSSMLMELCISELEDVAREPQLLSSSHPVVEESPHPYPDSAKLARTVHIPGAEALLVSFDMRCSTERRHDVLTIKDGGGAVIAVRSGRDSIDWAHDVRIVGEVLQWNFESDGSVNGWGFRFTVHPILPKKPMMEVQLSDRALQSHPSINLVTCLLDFHLDTTPNEDSVSRLGAALAACAQLSILDASQRTWAIQQFRRIINSSMGTVLVSEAIAPVVGPKESCGAISSLGSLVRGLPDALIKQYNYEIAHVSTGAHLQHSAFFQSLAALACDLELDTMECCSDLTKWTWFTQYCMAARTAKSLQLREQMPQRFLCDVNERINMLEGSVEGNVRTHEKHSVYRREHDEQLLLWMQRYSKDWTMPLGTTFSVYGWGHNHRGQLGGVEGNKIKSPKLCESFSELNPIGISGGEQTLFAITQDGKVYASGYGAYGRLGIGGTDNIAMPTVISSLAARGTSVKKVAVHSGGKHCLAVTTQGELYSWGEGDDGKLGLGVTRNVDIPQLVETLKGKFVVDAACGSSHSACITDDGSLYTWGKGRYGRLGHNDHETQYKPRQVVALKGEHVTCVACGSGDAQTLCATASGCVFSWGDGDYGKLGRGGNEGSKVPKKIDTLTGKGVIKLLCGSQFSMGLTSQGHVYTWGKGDYYRLGHADDSHQRTPRRVLGLLISENVVDIACGSLHCVVCTESGRVYAWGDNDEGQIGNDTTTAVARPCVIKMSEDVPIDHVSCGSAHSLAWSSMQRKLVCPLPLKVPVEFNHLQSMPLIVLRNRLILLHYFSNLFCKSLTMFMLQSDHGHEMDLGYDKLRGIIMSSSKESGFRRIIKATMTQGKQNGPVIELNRLQVKRARVKGGYAGPDGTMSVFGQFSSKWSILGSDDFRLPHRVWKVKFVGESVDDCGGGYSESIAEMCDELQNGSVPLLIQTPNGRDDTGVNRDCFIFNPESTSPVHLNMFRVLGVLLGIAIRSGSPINLQVAPPIWKQISGQPLTMQDLSEMDTDYMQGLVFIRENPEAFVGIDFAAPSASGHDISLHPSVTQVTMNNYQDYVKLAIHMRLHEFDVQTQAVREGMARVIPVPMLSLFTGTEIETLVCGSPEISIELLKSVTTYKGIEPTAPLARWFWEVMEAFNTIERSLFLRFVWGRTRLPRTTADFRGRDFVLQILDKYYPPDYYLPESYTCFFLLKLPRYSCKLVLEEKLRYAINLCKSIDTDDYARVNLQEGTLLDEADGD